MFIPSDIVRQAASAVAAREGLAEDWLNDAVKGFLPGPDPDAQRFYASDSLIVDVASPRYLLAMKLFAARAAIDRCKPWLSMSWGSTVPDDFELIKLIRHRPAFIRPETAVRLKKRESSVQLKMVGEGAYAIVYAFTDPDYGKTFAVKRAKKSLDERDLYR